MATPAFEDIVEDYEESILEATEESGEVKDKNKSADLLSIISDKAERHKETLDKVLEQVPEQAKEA